jgi:hypothetical protein
MFGSFNMTPEMFQRMAERLRERDRRADTLKATGMSSAEAYMRVTCEMEHEEWQAAEQRKLDDIRENGT